MSGLKIMTYGGYVPRVAPHLLNDNEAQKALNAKLYSGSLQSWKKPGQLVPRIFVASDTQTIYRGKNTSSDVRWIAWNTDVDVAKSPILGSQYMNIFYTGDGVPKKTNSTLAGSTNGTAPASSLYMGVKGPNSAPTVARVGSGTTPETRVYVYTYVNTYGDIEEESMPSPASALVLCGTGDTVTVSGFATALTTGYNITKRRIYRSVSGTNATQFQLVTEIPLATTTFTDNVLSAGLGETLSTQLWSEPPANLKGLIALPNGFLAGFFGQTLCFSEVNAPHAWPENYQLSIGSDIIGIAAFGQSIAVMTSGYPHIVSGVTPESMSVEKIPSLEPCISKRSIVSTATGVTYASPNGLVNPSSGLLTGNVMLRDDFAEYNPSSIRAAFFAGKYFGFFEASTSDVTTGAFILDSNIAGTPLTVTTLYSSASFVDSEDANMYLVQGTEIMSWEGDENNTLPYEWQSKNFVFTAPTNMGAIEVEADFNGIGDAVAIQARIAELVALNQSIFSTNSNLKGVLNTTPLNTFDINGSILKSLPGIIDDRYVLISLFCDDKLINTSQYTKRGVYRLPSGYKGQIFSVKINGNIELKYIKMAETAKQLKAL